MPLLPIENLNDPRLRAYRDLKDRELALEGNLFMAEGRLVVDRLVRSRHQVASVLSEPVYADAFAARLPEDTPIYVAPRRLLEQIIGFKFHRGLLACGVRPTNPTLAEFAAAVFDGADETSDAHASSQSQSKPRTLLACPQILNHDNLGAIMRVAAAFGVDGILIGPRSCDPWWRRSIRVSMGEALDLPIYMSDDLLRDVAWLREHANFHAVATVTDLDATPLPEARRPAAPADQPDRLCIVLGPEDLGLSDKWRAACDQRITIPMHAGVDSLNVVVAGSIVLYHYATTAKGGLPMRPRV